MPNGATSEPGGTLRAKAQLLRTFRNHTTIEIALNLNETNAISSPRPFLGRLLG